MLRIAAARVVLASALVATFSSFVVGAQAADPPWTATQLCDGMSVGHAINDSGVVAGTVGSGLTTRAAVCDADGVLTYLAMPEEATASSASAINDVGQVAGLVQVDGFQEAVVWDGDGSMTRLGFLPGGGPFSSARDINDNGEVVGIANAGGGVLQGFHWSGTGPIEALPLPPGATGSFAVAINDGGQIVGSASAIFQPSSAILWDAGVPSVLPPLAAGAAAVAEDINELGVIVGNSATTGPPFTARHPVLWAGGSVVDLGSLGGTFGSAAGVNDDGQVVGLMSDALNRIRAFVWEAGLMTELEPLSGDEGSAAQDVGADGKVVGASFTGAASRGTMWQQLADTTPPELRVSVDPNVLWPPNHGYVRAQATVTASDNLDPNPTVALESVTSNEPDNGPDDGNTVNDIVIESQYAFRLRAERNESGTGRIYTITYRATDVSGNSAVRSATVTVPITR